MEKIFKISPLFMGAVVLIFLSVESPSCDPEVKLLSSDHVTNAEYTLRVYVDGREVTEQVKLHEGENLIERSYFGKQGREIHVVHEIFLGKSQDSSAVFRVFMEKLKVSYSVFIAEMGKAKSPDASGGDGAHNAALTFFKTIISECQVIVNFIFKNDPTNAQHAVSPEEGARPDARRFFKAVLDESNISVNALAVDAAQSSAGTKSTAKAARRVQSFFELIMRKTEAIMNYFGSPPESPAAVITKSATYRGSGQAEFVAVTQGPATRGEPKAPGSPENPIGTKAKPASYEPKPAAWKESKDSDFTGVSTRVVFPDEFGGMIVIVENQRTKEKLIIHKDRFGRELRRRTEPLWGPSHDA